MILWLSSPKFSGRRFVQILVMWGVLGSLDEYPQAYFSFFRKFVSEGRTSPLKMAQSQKYAFFWHSIPPIFRLRVCSNLFIQGFLGTPDEYPRMYFSLFQEIVSATRTSPQKMAPNPKIGKNGDFLDIFQVGVWVALKGSACLFWIYGNLRGCSRGICS